jgi:hypothetical protein
MRLTCALFTVMALAISAPLMAQAPASAEPFKLGTFEINGDRHVGIVLRDRWIVELNAANRALERSPSYPSLPMPADMLELISRYEYGVKYRLYEIVTNLATNNLLADGRRPAYLHDVTRVRTLAPILYPGKILNAGGNFYTHLAENNTPELQKVAIEARVDGIGTLRIPVVAAPKPPEGTGSMLPPPVAAPAGGRGGRGGATPAVPSPPAGGRGQ